MESRRLSFAVLVLFSLCVSRGLGQLTGDNVAYRPGELSSGQLYRWRERERER